MRVAAIMAWILIAAPMAVAAQEGAGAPGTVVEVRVHGNHTTPDWDVLAIVGDVVGAPATDALVAEVAARLERSGRFDGVDVRKRFRSIASLDDILLIVVVDEVTAVSEDDLTPGPWKKLRSSGMFLPIVRHDDRYGFTYGARVSFVDRLGPRSRISVPLTWGGERQVRMQVERTFDRGPINRLVGDMGAGRRENPHFNVADTRTGVNIRAESVVRRWLRIGAGAGYGEVRFDGVPERLGRIGGDVTIDTRVDPAFPRNAVHAAFGIERLSFGEGRATRRNADVRGYVGFFGQSVLAVRGLSITSADQVPVYEQALLGGSTNLRGFHAGHRAGDNLAAATVELRMPVTSPLSIGRFGVKVFADAGTVYGAGEPLKGRRFEQGYGAGVYTHLTILSLSLDVAKARDRSTTWHLGVGVNFR